MQGVSETVEVFESTIAIVATQSSPNPALRLVTPASLDACVDTRRMYMNTKRVRFCVVHLDQGVSLALSLHAP